MLRRDPWLVSQTLMQMLYLIPPAVLLWRSFRRRQWRLSVPGAGSGHGGGPACRRSLLACDFRRGRARPRRHGARAAAALSSAPRSRPCSASSPSSSRPLLVVLAIASPWHALITAAASSSPRRGDLDPALVPQPGQAQPVSPPSGVFARRHLRRGFLLDRLGRDRGRRRGQSLACHRARPDRARRGCRRPLHEPAPETRVNWAAVNRLCCFVTASSVRAARRGGARCDLRRLPSLFPSWPGSSQPSFAGRSNKTRKPGIWQGMSEEGGTFE